MTAFNNVVNTKNLPLKGMEPTTQASSDRTFKGLAAVCPGIDMQGLIAMLKVDGYFHTGQNAEGVKTPIPTTKGSEFFSRKDADSTLFITEPGRPFISDYVKSRRKELTLASHKGVTKSPKPRTQGSVRTTSTSVSEPKVQPSLPVVIDEPINITPATPATLDDWKLTIGNLMVKTAQGILETGHAIHLFKQSREVAQGGSDFSSLMHEWFNMEQSVASQWTQIGARYDELMVITISLPASKSAIHAIAKLPSELLATAVTEEFIKPNVTVKQVKQFAKSHKPTPAPKAAPPATLEGECSVIPDGYVPIAEYQALEDKFIKHCQLTDERFAQMTETINDLGLTIERLTGERDQALAARDQALADVDDLLAQ